MLKALLTMSAGWFVAVAVLAADTAAVAQDAVRWQKDLEVARRLAAQTNRLVLVHYWAPWCGPCAKMDRDVFSLPTIDQRLAANFVPVKLNVDQFPASAREMGVESLPADVVLTPQGKVLHKMQSPTTADEYLARLSQVAAQHRAASSGAAVADAGPTADPRYGSTLSAPIAPAYGAAAAGAPHEAAPSDPLDRYSDYYSRRQLPRGEGAAAPYDPRTAAPTETPWAAEPAAPMNIHGAGGSHPPTGTGGTFPAYPEQAPYPPRTAAPPSTPPAAGYSPAPAPEGRAAAPNAAGDRYAAAPPPHAPHAPVAPPHAPYAADMPPTSPLSGAAPPSPHTPHAAMPPAPSQPPAAGSPPPAGPASMAAGGSSPPGHPPLGLDGYCPVQLVKHQRWVLGDARWGAIHEGRTYLFAGWEEQQQFLSDPQRYGPVAAGHDPVLAVEQHQFVPGRREHGVYFQDRIYLFASEDSLARFSQMPDRYAERFSPTASRWR